MAASRDLEAPEGAAVAPPAFVGRESALASVITSLESSAVVLVEGEAGIGKTRFLRECLATPGLSDRVVLAAACPPVDDPFPLGAIVDGLRRLGRLTAEGVELSPLCGALRPLFPDWASWLPPPLEPLGDAAETRHRLLAALSELVDRIGVGIIVVEDAHWADAATLEWLLVLTASGDLGFSVMVSFRPTDVPAGSLLLRLTSRSPAGMGRVRIPLKPLDVAQTRLLVGSMLDTDEVSEEFAGFLHERTDGLPLALEETVRLMRERHDIIRQSGSWTRRALEDLEVPPTVRDSVLERVDRLDSDARAMLRAAAILGEPADEPLLTSVANLDDRVGRRGAAAAVGAGLMRDAGGGRLVFRHVLDAQAVADAIPVSEQWSLHRRAAQELQRWETPPVVRLARHFKAAGDAESWSHYAEAAAELALESGDERTAVALLHELLTGIEHPTDRRIRLARRLGEVTANRAAPLGELETEVRESLARVVDDEDVPVVERGEVRYLLGWLLFQLGDFDAGHAEIEAAAEELGARPERAARAMLFLAHPESPQSWTAARHLEWLERATDLIPQVESASVRQALSMERAVALLLLGKEEGWQAAADNSEAGATLLEQHQVLRGRLNVAIQAIAWGRYTEARQRLAAVAESAEAIGLQRIVDFVRFNTALLDWYTGAWLGLAETLAALEEAEETHPLIRQAVRSIQGTLELLCGRRGAAEQRLWQVLEQTTGIVVETPTVLATAALGRLSLADGAAHEAVQVTAVRVDAIAAKGTWLWATDIAPVHLDTLVGVDQLDRAADLVDEFSAWVDGRSARASAASLATCRAIVADAQGDREQAAQLFGAAANAWAGLPRPYDELLALERQGICLLDVGQRDKGIEVLSDAQRRFGELGAKWDADRAARLLRQHGVEVARAWRRGRRGYGDQLSPRELEVVELVARGMANKQIAEHLYISPRTVSRHLSTAMRKLSVSSRTALAMAAADAGLLSDEANR